MLQHLAQVDHPMVFRETQACLQSIVQTEEVRNIHFMHFT